MKAIVMAGGQGTRLRPLTVARPKPLMPVCNKPVVGHIFDWLKRHHVCDAVVTLQHQADWFQSYLDTWVGPEIDVAFAIEDVPLGTAGGVANVFHQGLIDPAETVLVVSGDAVTDIDLTALLAFHHAQQADVTIALTPVADPLEYGVVITEADGRITQFLEKPGWSEVVSDLVNTGIYAIRASILGDVPAGEFYDFSQDLFPKLLEQGRRLYGFKTTDYWCDVGNPNAYYRANADMLQNRVAHEPLGRMIGGDIWVGNHVDIAPDAQLYGPIYLGNGVQIKGGVVIQGPAVIRDDTVVDTGAFISRSVLWRGCYVGENAQIIGAVISKQCVFKARVLVQEGVVIGDRCVVGEGAVLYENVKLWPGKEVEPGAQVRESIIWGSQGRKVLFTRFGVSGVVNIDFTPEFAAKLGVAFGASLPRGSLVTINRDTHASSRMLKRAIISGLPAAGVDVLDLRTQAVPVVRHYTRVSEAVAGVHVRISPYDRRVVDVRFMDGNGLNLGRVKERQVEQLFFREDFRRAQLDDIGSIDYAGNVEEIYIKAFLQAVDQEVIRNAGMTIAVDYAHASTVDVLEPILAQLHVDVVALNTRPDPQTLSVLESDWQRGIDLLARLVQAMNLRVGARLDVSGEKLFFVDEYGRIIDDLVASVAMAEIILREHPQSTIAVPIDQSSVFDHIATRHGGHVIRTKVDVHSLMKTAAEEHVQLALDGNGHFLLPDFQPVPDGMYALVRLLQHMARTGTALGDIIDSLPPVTWRHRHIACPWEAKGRVMRAINEHAESYAMSAVDGVRYHLDNERWVHIRPDPDRALMRVCAEAPTLAETDALIDEQLSWLQDAIASA